MERLETEKEEGGCFLGTLAFAVLLSSVIPRSERYLVRRTKTKSPGMQGQDSVPAAPHFVPFNGGRSIPRGLRPIKGPGAFREGQVFTPLGDKLGDRRG